MLALAVAAYAIGYHRGEHHARAAAAPRPATTTPTTTQAAPSTTTTGTATVPVTAALVARGKQLYSADSCVGCHSVTGTAGAGPTFKGLAGTSVNLDNGKTVTADDAYLERSITSPDAEVVKGFHSGIMAPAISGFGLSGKPADLRALVAFIKSQK